MTNQNTVANVRPRMLQRPKPQPLTQRNPPTEPGNLLFCLPINHQSGVSNRKSLSLPPLCGRRSRTPTTPITTSPSTLLASSTTPACSSPATSTVPSTSARSGATESQIPNKDAACSAVADSQTPSEISADERPPDPPGDGSAVDSGVAVGFTQGLEDPGVPWTKGHQPPLTFKLPNYEITQLPNWVCPSRRAVDQRLRTKGLVSANKHAACSAAADAETASEISADQRKSPLALDLR
jgi:hypothetical protein